MATLEDVLVPMYLYHLSIQGDGVREIDRRLDYSLLIFANSDRQKALEVVRRAATEIDSTRSQTLSR